MPATRSHSQQAASRLNGARSPGAVTAAGKARSARNGTRHGLRGGPFALLPGADREEFAALHAAVTADWRPRDAYEHRCVTELVTCMWRQDPLRALELATLAAAAAESPPGEATMKKLLTFARYGARIDKDIGRALRALRVLRDRPDARIDELQNGTPDPGSSEPHQQNYTNDLPPRTCEPGRRAYIAPPPADSSLHPPAVERGTAEPVSRLNRHQSRALAAIERRRAA